MDEGGFWEAVLFLRSSWKLVVPEWEEIIFFSGVGTVHTLADNTPSVLKQATLNKPSESNTQKYKKVRVKEEVFPQEYRGIRQGTGMNTTKMHYIHV